MNLQHLYELRLRAGEADAAFRKAVAEAYAEGHSLRAIGEAVGLSHEAIRKIVKQAKHNAS